MTVACVIVSMQSNQSAEIDIIKNLIKRRKREGLNIEVVTPLKYED